jgi:hypothetical protein
MTVESNIIYIYYSYLLISVIGILIVGSLVTRLLISFEQSPITKSFLNMFFGLIVVVIGYSIISTNGISISLGYIFLFFLYLIYKNFYHTNQEGISSSYSIVIFNKGVNIEIAAIVSIFFIMQAFSIFNSSEGLLYIPMDPDRSLFSDVISFISTTGVESYKIDYLSPKSVGVSPYHYLELWLTGFIAVLFSSNILITDHLVSAPIFGIIIYIGFRAISEIFNVSRVYSIIASFLLVGMSLGVQFPLIDHLHDLLGRTEDYFQLSVLEYPKFFGIYLFHIAAIIFYFNKRYLEALVCLLSIPISNILMAPSILLSAGIMLILGYKKNLISTKQLYFGAILTLSTFLFIVIFYQIFGIEGFSSSHTVDIDRLTSDFIGSILSLTSINIMAGTIIQIIYMLLPFIILSILIKKNFLSYLRDITIVTPILLWVFFVILTGLISWVILQNHPESSQVSIRFAFVATNLVAFIIIMLTYVHNKYVGWFFLLIILFIKLDYSYLKFNNKKIESSNLYSQEFLGDVEKEFSEISPRGVFIRHESSLKARRSKSVLIRIGQFTNLYNLYPMNISDFTGSFSSNYIKGILEKSDINSIPFYKFINQQQLNKTFESIKKSQYNFIIKNNINYLILESLAELPKTIEPLVKKKYVDNKSGESLYILNTEP